MTKLFQHSPENRFHISVGAVLVREDGKICVHKMTKDKTPARYTRAFESGEEIFILMRESLENQETLEDAVLRGIKEEFGATGAIRRYLGSLVSEVRLHEYPFEKTTLYFEVSLKELGPRLEDEESYTDLEWHHAEELIRLMKAQASGVADLDESKIIESYVRYS